MKKMELAVILMAVLSCFIVQRVNAQSTVYFFVGTTSSNECTLKMNGEEIGELRGPLKKTMAPVAPMKIPMHTYSPCYKKCIINEEGKVLFVADYKFTNISTLAVSDIPSEIQLNLSKGSVHYVELSPKGLNNLQFKEIEEKAAQKLLNNKKYVALPEYIQ